MTVTIWRLQTNTDNKNKDGKIAQYCLDNKVVAMGWSLLYGHVPDSLKPIIKTERTKIKTYKDFRAFIETHGIYKNKNGKINTDSVNRLSNQLKTDDLIWMRLDGIYWLGRCTENSEYTFNYSAPEDNDAANQVTNIDWVKVGDESEVPGAVTIALIRGSTFQRINKEGIAEVSQLIYNQKINRDHYTDVIFENTMDNFFTLISPTGCEDLLCMYLYSKENYICIPSTNKIATELYECVLLNPLNGKTAYIQSKEYNNSDAKIEGSKYLHLLKGNEKVYFFLHKASHDDIIDKNPDMVIIDSQTLYDFAQASISRNTLPKNIITWVDFMKQYAQH